MKRGVFLILLLSVLLLAYVQAGDAAIVTSPYRYLFNKDGTLYEAGTQQESTSPYWWLNSGAKLIISSGVGKTIQNELPENDKWRLIYLNSNPIDTDNGYHPQNLFRLITRSKWQNVQEVVYFKIIRDQLSSSPNRDASNGLLLMSRYQNDNTLYYTGIRVDGRSVIKKKLNGKYYTLASEKIFSGTYDRLTNPNLLQKNIWIGLKTQITNNNESVNIAVYIDKGRTGIWTLVLEANDDGRYEKPLQNEGYSGIRTDFMDVEFEDFSMTNV